MTETLLRIRGIRSDGMPVSSASREPVHDVISRLYQDGWLQATVEIADTGHVVGEIVPRSFWWAVR